MDTPSRLQAHLLRGIQNLALDHQQRRTQLSESGPSADASAQLQIGERSLTLLEQVAAGVGVPQAWIAYSRAAGERGDRWRPGQQLLGSGYVDRDRLLAGLGREVRELQHMAGVGAVFTRHGGLDSDVVARFRRVMGMTWQRLGAMSHALGLTREEQHQVWARGDRHWSTAVAEQVRAADSRSVAQSWNRIVATDFSALTVPVVVLQAAGITAEDLHAGMPISPDDMVAHVADALTAAEQRADTALAVTDPSRSSEAAAISAAVEAAGADNPELDAPSIPDGLGDAATAITDAEIDPGTAL
ncbi:hypothetical protein [Nocardia noduli]|uniref:hypothetical protein n=1 Tax=Nocardia noduli TaxID=2815722 RepID=UPI001C2155AB|nr:hypothetical protein [Nocardia noduli]